ncbi:nuclear transport factor 2 family protein [Xanthomonas arboricola]|uniref:nuclear transport factor 2 family protein n=1 Tax=Xanthomonas arboricola TaxID=56448 RepID=UPI0009BB0D39|nr:nuclear transport factor 2 family protein [Xanthomonas arboricola]
MVASLQLAQTPRQPRLPAPYLQNPAEQRTGFTHLAARLEPAQFEVRRILADGETAVALGELASRVRASGKLIETPFAFVLTVRQGQIVHYRMLEDSHAVAVAASGQNA